MKRRPNDPEIVEFLEGTAYRVRNDNLTWYKGGDKAEPLPAPEGNALQGVIWAIILSLPIWAAIIALFAWLDHC